MLDRTFKVEATKTQPSDQPPGPRNPRNPFGWRPGDNSPQGASEATEDVPKGHGTTTLLDSCASAQDAGHRSPETHRRLADTQSHPAGDGGEGQATYLTQTTYAAPDLQPSASAGGIAIFCAQTIKVPQSPKSPRKGRIGQSKYAPHSLLADAINPASHDPVRTGSNSQQDEAVIEGQLKAATQYPVALDDRRFIDPLIQEIVELWRQRQDMVRAQSKLTLQIKAICRRFSGGDKSEADKLYKRIEAGEAHPAAMACAVLFMARTPLEDARKSYEKHLTKLGKQLPIAHMADSIKGIGHLALAKIVGECGDLSAYKSVAAVWKRAGLAVIEGERQRKVPGDAALLHGYSPQRRSTLWNIADPMLKAQGKDEGAGPYRKLYDAHKAAQLDKGLPLIHAHNRAMRYMTKALLKDLTLEWRRIARDPAGMPEPVGPGKHDTPRTVADRHIFMEAAE